MIFFTTHNYNNLISIRSGPFIKTFELKLTMYYISQNKTNINKDFASDNHH